jgi:hypothetical protein
MNALSVKCSKCSAETGTPCHEIRRHEACRTVSTVGACRRPHAARIAAAERAAATPTLFDAAPATELVVVVPCSATKAPGLYDETGELYTAATRYTGSFHTYARAHAARLGADRVLVLSAAYGLIELGHLVADYEKSIDAKDSIVSTPGKVAHQALRLGLLEPGVVVVSLCPAAYTRELRRAVPAVVAPLEGSRGIGEQRGRIARLDRDELTRTAATV